MCKNSNCDMIESRDFRLSVLKNRFKNNPFTVTPLDITGNELDGMIFRGFDPKTVYYGILSVGVDTTAELSLLNGEKFLVSENSQIIEMFRKLSKTDDNLYFYGWEITFTTDLPVIP
ncbi:structural protein [Cellulophaga phage phi48:2]|uniref:structural protein n=1 Tax=Cellulophaga phage phi48:2 TaxID=1327968 RepID=UPI000351FB6E|nr:structural protein [Cellulophaga phage phi48:2]AGO47272.1 structural protein [Cellulophaga phage phi48:2]